MKKLFVSSVIIVSAFASCGPEEPTELKYLYESKNVPLGGIAVCCEQPGNTCVAKTKGFFPTSFRTYVEHDSLSYYFQTQDWQTDLPELTGYPQLIDTIIRTNPRGMFLDDFAFVILKDRNNPSPSAENVHLALKMAPISCKEFLEQF